MYDYIYYMLRSVILSLCLFIFLYPSLNIKLSEQNISHPCAETQWLHNTDTDSVAEESCSELSLYDCSVTTVVSWNE